MKPFEDKSIVGFTCGAFDLLHPGHLFFLSEARNQCTYLVVGLHTNPNQDRPLKNKPVQTMYERWFQLSSTKWVDEVVPYDTEADLLNMLATLDIDVRFLGWDYKDKKITGEQICIDRSIELNYIQRAHNWSSSELRNRVK